MEPLTQGQDDEHRSLLVKVVLGVMILTMILIPIPLIPHWRAAHAVKSVIVDADAMTIIHIPQGAADQFSSSPTSVEFDLSKPIDRDLATFHGIADTEERLGALTHSLAIATDLRLDPRTTSFAPTVGLRFSLEEPEKGVRVVELLVSESDRNVLSWDGEQYRWFTRTGVTDDIVRELSGSLVTE